MANVVYTYFEPVAGLQNPGRLLALWAKSWQERGFTPKVLTENDARSHPAYDVFNRKVTRFPTVNPKDYERACFLRHLAVANVAPKGDQVLLTDYDVLWNPRYDGTVNWDFGFGKYPEVLEATGVPCALMGDNETFENLCDLFYDYEPGIRNHVSDMTIVREQCWLWYAVCVEYLLSGSKVANEIGEGWRNAALIHFSGGSFKKLGWSGNKADMVLRALHGI